MSYQPNHLKITTLNKENFMRDTVKISMLAGAIIIGALGHAAVTGNPAVAQTAVRTNVQWEYTAFNSGTNIIGGKEYDNYIVGSNYLGQQGWELFAIDNSIFHFKRIRR
jgi:hypothetical protein